MRADATRGAGTIVLVTALAAAAVAVYFAMRWAPPPAPPEPEPAVVSAREPVPALSNSEWLPVTVVIARDIVLDDGHQHYPFDPYVNADWHALAADHLRLDMGLGDGYSGRAIELRLHPEKQLATFRVFDTNHIGPRLVFWSDVVANIKLSSWTLTPDTRIDVDVSGRSGTESRSLHLRSTLRNRRPTSY